jgi:hypothetical protein
MAQYAASFNATAVASATNLNMLSVYSTVVNMVGLVKMYTWGGGDTSLISQMTRWARIASNTPATPVAVTSVMTNSSAGPAALSLAASTWTTAPTQTAGVNLDLRMWNSQGGGGAIVLPIGGEWMWVGAALAASGGNGVAVGSVAGSGSNLTFGFQWAE